MATPRYVLLFGVLISLAQGFQSTCHYSLSQRQSQQQQQGATSTSLRARSLLGRFRKKREVAQTRTIAVGDVIPDVDVEVVHFGTSNEETTTSTPISIRQVFGEKEGSSVFVGMPGAFTPTCSKEHLPGFVNSVGKFQALGINKVVVMTTNDRHVNEEWGSRYNLIPSDKGDAATASSAPITIVSDGDGDLAKAMGLADDMGFGVGVRSKRFAMVVNEGGVVSTLLTDEGLNDCSETSAQNLLRILTPEGSVAGSQGGVDMGMALMGGGAALVLGLLFALSGGGGGGGDQPRSAPTPKVQVQRGKQQQPKQGSSQFSMLEEYR